MQFNMIIFFEVVNDKESTMTLRNAYMVMQFYNAYMLGHVMQLIFVM